VCENSQKCRSVTNSGPVYNSAMMLSVPERAELALSLACAAPSADLACTLVDGASRFLDLYRPPEYAPYDPEKVLAREKTAPQSAAPPVFYAEAVGEVAGDAAQVAGIVRLLVESAQLDEGAVLLVDVFRQPDRLEKEGVPCVALAFDGAGRFPATFSFGDGMSLAMDELQARWTLATRGGRIDPAPNGLLLRLKGQRMAPEPTAALEPIREAVVKASCACGKGKIDAARKDAGEALDLIDGPAAPELADLKALVLDVLRENRQAFEACGATCETLFASELPPVPVLRERLRGLFRRILAYAVESQSPGAAVTILFEYNAPRRAILFVATISGIEEVPGHAAFLASFRRTVEAHDGSLELSAEPTEVNLTVSLPDPVGQAVHQEIPGFDAFCAESQKVLRLLWSGGQAPPAEILLEGLLEEELSRWLLPQFEQPLFVNVAHELAERGAVHPVAAPEKLEKVLDQIRKGKPKRELAKPPFAAELINAWSADSRSREAIAAGPLSQAEMKKLAAALAKTPGTKRSLLACLRLLAKRLASD